VVASLVNLFGSICVITTRLKHRCAYRHGAYTHGRVWPLLWWLLFRTFWKEFVQSQQGSNTAVRIGTVRIHTAGSAPCCDGFFCEPFGKNLCNHNMAQTPLCVQARCVYTQQGLEPAVMTSLEKKIEVICVFTTGFNHRCAYMRSAYTHNRAWTPWHKTSKEKKEGFHQLVQGSWLGLRWDHSPNSAGFFTIGIDFLFKGVRLLTPGGGGGQGGGR